MLTVTPSTCFGSAAPSRPGAPKHLPSSDQAMLGVTAVSSQHSRSIAGRSSPPVLYHIAADGARIPAPAPRGAAALGCSADGCVFFFGFSTLSAFLPASSEPLQTRNASNSP